VTSFLLSLVGMALSFGYQFAHPSDLAATHEGPMAFMPYVIIVVGIVLLFYARSVAKKGQLR
jgi:hypothetical protein